MSKETTRVPCTYMGREYDHRANKLWHMWRLDESVGRVLQVLNRVWIRQEYIDGETDG